MSNLNYAGNIVTDSQVGFGAPAMYDYVNATNSTIHSSPVHVGDSVLAHYFKRYLFQKAISVFKWELPENWNRDYFLYVLYSWGCVAVINTNKFGVIPQGCGLQGYDIFYQPKKAVITNPLLSGILQPVIDEQCTLFKLQPDFGGIIDLVNHYADMLSLSWQSAQINLLNSKLAYVFFAKNKPQAETYKSMFDDIASGNPAVVIDKDLLKADGTQAWQPFQQNIGQNYLMGDIISDMRKIEAMFDTDIGIPNANTDKKERLITDEVQANNTETGSKCELWLEELQKVCEKTKKMFGVNISVDWRVKPQTIIEQPKQEKGGEENESDT